MKIFNKVFFSVLLFVALFRQGFAREYEEPFVSTKDSLTQQFYNNLHSQELSYSAFAYAFNGYQILISENKIGKKDILTIIDFSKSSKKERFFIIDISEQKVIYSRLVAHGKNSGWDVPSSFSNHVNSYKSSLGFFITGETYAGKHGLSLRLDGVEKGINDNARKRHIVIHAADYVNDGTIKKLGRLGRSYGCPSIPSENYPQIIDLIKGKSLIFIYSDQKDYLNKSKYL